VRKACVCTIRQRSILAEPDFEREPVERQTTCGHWYTAWRPTGVPRIADEMLQSVFYLYPSREAAEQGHAAGGTGFIVAYDSTKVPNTYFLFAVSNKHVVADSGASVMRLNKKDGGIDIIEMEPHEWYFTSNQDLAIVPIMVNLDKHRVKAVPFNDLISPDAIATFDIGPGDEVFMIGRFVNHDGKLVNSPSVRFGNLSMMVDNIEHPNLGVQESFAVEMRSMGGYSGSPVYVYPSAWNMNRRSTSVGGQRLFLLGVDWGHIVDHSEVREKIVSIEMEATARGRTIAYVAANTGMNGVVPAWRLAEMIKKNPWTEAIEAEERRIAAADAAATSGVVLDSAAPADGANPNHLGDFKRLVDVAALRRNMDVSAAHRALEVAPMSLNRVRVVDARNPFLFAVVDAAKIKTVF
jgi:hypothetical protein